MTKTNIKKPMAFTNIGILSGDQPITENKISIDLIDLPDSQPRKFFNPEKQDELVNSIRKHGILEPLIVRPKTGGRFELVAGERRLRAAKIVGLIDVPIVSKDFDDETAKQISLIENLQRENLSPLEETEAILQLIMVRTGTPRDETVKWLRHLGNHPEIEVPEDVIEIFESLSMSLLSYVKHRLGLLNLPEDTLEALAQGKIEYTKATEIGKIKDENERKELLEEVISEDTPLKEIKEKVKEAKQKAQESKEGEKDGKKKSAKIKSPEEDTGKIFSDLCREMEEKNPWNDPRNTKDIDKIIKLMKALL